MIDRILKIVSGNDIIGAIEITDFTYSASRMGDATLTATIMHPQCLDDLWHVQTWTDSQNVEHEADYVEINGEKFYIRQIPSSGKANDDIRYKHEIKFTSEREVLKETYAVLPYDINPVMSLSVNKMELPTGYAFTLNTIFAFYGLPYRVICDASNDSKSNFDYAHEEDNYKRKLVSLEESTLWDALQRIKDTWDLNFFFGGRTNITENGNTVSVLTIYLGEPRERIQDGENEMVFEYGSDKSFLNIQKANSGEKAIKSITGKGGTMNIPYYYPNPTPRGMIGVDCFKGRSMSSFQLAVSDPLLFYKMMNENDYLVYRRQPEVATPVIFSVDGQQASSAQDLSASKTRYPICHEVKARVTILDTGTCYFSPTYTDEEGEVKTVDVKAILSGASNQIGIVGVNVTTQHDGGIAPGCEVIATNEMFFKNYGVAIALGRSLKYFFEQYAKISTKERGWYYDVNDTTLAASADAFSSFCGKSNVGGGTHLYCGGCYIFSSKQRTALLNASQFFKDHSTSLTNEILESGRITRDERYIIYDDGKYYARTMIAAAVGERRADYKGLVYNACAVLWEEIEIDASVIPQKFREIIELNPTLLEGITIFDLTYERNVDKFIRNVKFSFAGNQAENTIIPFEYTRAAEWRPHEGIASFAYGNNSVAFDGISDTTYIITLLAVSVFSQVDTVSYNIGQVNQSFSGPGWYKNKYQKISAINKLGLREVGNGVNSEGDYARPSILWRIQPAEHLLPTLYRATGGVDFWYKAQRLRVEAYVSDAACQTGHVYRHPTKGLLLCVSFSQKGKHWKMDYLTWSYEEDATAIEYKSLIPLPFQTAIVDGVEYLNFENEYQRFNPCQKIYSNEDIYPTIEGTKHNSRAIGEVAEAEYDSLDDDSTFEQNGSIYYAHPYFFVKLNPLGFNLFTHGIESGNMTLEFQSGDCAGCKFEIGVSENGYNLVQVDSNNQLKRYQEQEIGKGGADLHIGDVKRSGSAEGARNDTTSQVVWIALKKDIDSFGVVMPNGMQNKRVRQGDKFIITNISLPEYYIEDAERRLDEELIKDLHDCNSEKFVFSGTPSRIFCQEKGFIPALNVLNRLNENAWIAIRYNNRLYSGESSLKVMDYTYRSKPNEALPEISLTMSENVRVYRNPFAASRIAENKTKVILMGYVNDKTTAPTTTAKAASANADLLGGTVFTKSADTDDESSNGGGSGYNPGGGSNSGSSSGTTNHAELTNRDADDQHPMSAITGLDTAINDINEQISTIGETVDTLDTLVSDFDTDLKSLEDTVNAIPDNYLCKTKDDTSSGTITSAGFISDIVKSIGAVANGMAGSGFTLKNEDGVASMELDNLIVRRVITVFQTIIQQWTWQGGIRIDSSAAIKAKAVSEESEYYQVTFDSDTYRMPFAVGDLARCQRYDSNANASKYYWRKVTAVGDDFIRLSKVSGEYDGDGVPEIGDEIIQLGNVSNTARQAAIIYYSVGADSPKIEFYDGINSFSLINHLVTYLGKRDGKMILSTNNGEFTGLIKSPDNTSMWNLQTGELNIKDRLIMHHNDVTDSDECILQNVILRDVQGAEIVVDNYTGPYNSSITYQKGQQVSYTIDGVTSIYTYIYDTPSSGHLPTETLYWDLSVSGGVSFVWKGEWYVPPSGAKKNWAYRNIRDGKVYIFNGYNWELMVSDGSDGEDGADGEDGEDGEDGLSVFITYNDSEEEPSKPRADSAGNSDGWHTDSTSDVVWMSQKVAESATAGEWGDPIKIKGEKGNTGSRGPGGPAGPSGPYTEYRYYTSGSTVLSGFIAGYEGLQNVSFEVQRTQRNPKGWTVEQPELGVGECLWAIHAKIAGDDITVLENWSTPVRISGKDGAAGSPGTPGTDGRGYEFAYIASVNRPSTPYGDNPEGWSEDYPVILDSAISRSTPSGQSGFVLGSDDWYNSGTTSDRGSKIDVIRVSGQKAGDRLVISLKVNSEKNYDWLLIGKLDADYTAVYSNIQTLSSQVAFALSGPEDGYDEVSDEYAITFNDANPHTFVIRYQKDYSGANRIDRGCYRFANDITNKQSIWLSQRIVQGSSKSAWSTPVRVTAPVDAPKSGPAAPYRGNYRSNVGVAESAKVWYYGNPQRTDIVKYNGTYYVARVDAPDGFRGFNADPTNALYWNPFGAQYTSVATELLLAQYANIAGFVHVNETIMSQRGTVNGTISTDITNTNFVPNLLLDGVNGIITLGGTIRMPYHRIEDVGTIYADGYKLTSLVSNIIAQTMGSERGRIIYLPRCIEGMVYNIFCLPGLTKSALDYEIRIGEDGNTRRLIDPTSGLQNNVIGAYERIEIGGIRGGYIQFTCIKWGDIPYWIVTAKNVSEGNINYFTTY